MSSALNLESRLSVLAHAVQGSALGFRALGVGFGALALRLGVLGFRVEGPVESRST